MIYRWKIQISGLSASVNPEIIEAVGIANYSQAWDRAQYEFNRIIHSRVKVTTTVSAEGGLLSLNDRIDHVDGTDLNDLASDGELTEISGLMVRTSERCTFEDGKRYTVILRDELGNPSAPIRVTQRSDTEFGFVLSSLPSFSMFVRGDTDYQRGCLYSFCEDGDHLKISIWFSVLCQTAIFTIVSK